MPSPLASIVVRSYHRPDALMELLERLRGQDWPEFEVVVVEQSADQGLLDRIAELGDPRIRVLPRPPLGAPGARNEGVRHSRGDVVLLIDDDDLPLRNDWVTLHMDNYRDPLVMGVVGRMYDHPDHPVPMRFPRLVRHMALRHTFMKDPFTFAYGSLRKDSVDFLIGSNASVRRELVLRVGGWDEGVPMGEEQSFAFRFAQGRRPGERFVYDPNPLVWRRVGIPGGLDRRSHPQWHIRELESRVVYYRDVVGHYFPWRYRLLYPLYVARLVEQTWEWIWDRDNRWRTLSVRLRATAEVVTKLPTALRRPGQDRDGVRRVESL